MRTLNTNKLASSLHGIRAARRQNDNARLARIQTEAASESVAHQRESDDYKAHGDRSHADEQAADVWLQVSLLANDARNDY